MKKFLSALLLVAGMGAAFAQGPLLDPIVVPEFERDASGQDAHMDFTIKLFEVGGGNTLFGTFSGKPLLIFYFMPTCGHCQHAYPLVEQMAAKYKNLSLIAVASGGNSEESVEEVRAGRKVHAPLFQDKSKRFNEKYGIGSVPLLVLVDSDGRYIRYRSFSEEVQRQLAEKLDKIAK